MQLVPGKLVVFEGLDATGKSTGKEALAKQFPADATFLTHQPSGETPLGQDIYNLTERNRYIPGLSRQFLHLASHVEHYQNTIIPALAAGLTVFLDRCWWSTVAYGWYCDESIRELFATKQRFIALAMLPAQHRLPDVCFVHTVPFEEDTHNSAELLRGYRELHQMFRSYARAVPACDTVEQRVEWYTQAMLELGIVTQ